MIKLQVYLNPMDLIFNAKQQPANLENIYKGSSCFFIGAGPSLNQLDSSLLSQRGILTFAVNNIAARNIRPNIWCCIDKPKSFHRNIWCDPAILKFTKTENSDHGFDGGMVNHVPNLFWFKINTFFNSSIFFSEKSISCGCSSTHTDNLGISGGRSVMLPSIRIMHYLGIRTIYLLGCDFNMQPNKPYAFEQTKWSGGIKTNNKMYEILTARLQSLQPKMAELGLKVFNCSPDSKLDIFPRIDFQQAIDIETSRFDKNPNLKSMYESAV